MLAPLSAPLNAPIEWPAQIRWLNHQLVSDDAHLKWLCEETVLTLGGDISVAAGLHKLHVADAVPRLSVALGQAMSDIGLTLSAWKTKPHEEHLPMLGFHADHGFYLIQSPGEEPSTWHCISMNGESVCAFKAFGWLFATLAPNSADPLPRGAMAQAMRLAPHHWRPLLAMTGISVGINALALSIGFVLMAQLDQPLLQLDSHELTLLCIIMVLGVALTELLNRWRMVLIQTASSTIHADGAIEDAPNGPVLRLLLMAYSAFFVDAPMMLLMTASILYIGTPYLAGIAAVYVVLKSLHGLMTFRQAKAMLQVRGFVLPGEFVSGARQDSETAQSLGMSSWVEQRLRKLNQDQMTQNVRFHHFAIKALCDNHGLRQIGFIVWLIASAHLCEDPSGLSVGAWLAASLLATRAMASLSMLPLVSLQWLITTWVLLSQGRARVSDSVEQVNSASETPPYLRGLVRVNEMHFSHPGQLDGLYVPRWTVQPGERIALMGEPGSGKSTLIKLMAGLFHPDSGQVLIDDKVVNQFSVQWLNEEIAYLPQSVQLLNGTLRENLLAGRSNITDEILLDLCQRIGLMPLLNAQADGLSMPLHDAHQGVSAGQRQLIGLARLFLRRPRIWLLDEPFTHLNASMRERVANLMRSQILPEQTLICSGDHAETLQMVQRVVVLGGGRIIQDGLRDQVLAHHPVQWSLRQASALPV